MEPVQFLKLSSELDSQSQVDLLKEKIGSLLNSRQRTSLQDWSNFFLEDVLSVFEAISENMCPYLSEFFIADSISAHNKKLKPLPTRKALMQDAVQFLQTDNGSLSLELKSWPRGVRVVIRAEEDLAALHTASEAIEALEKAATAFKEEIEDADLLALQDGQDGRIIEYAEKTTACFMSARTATSNMPDEAPTVQDPLLCARTDLWLIKLCEAWTTVFGRLPKLLPTWQTSATGLIIGSCRPTCTDRPSVA